MNANYFEYGQKAALKLTHLIGGKGKVILLNYGPGNEGLDALAAWDRRLGGIHRTEVGEASRIADSRRGASSAARVTSVEERPLSIGLPQPSNSAMCLEDHLEKPWIRNVTITMDLVDTNTTERLLKLIAEGRLDPLSFATHRFPLSSVMEAYDTFAAAAETDALKVVLEAEPKLLEAPQERALAGVAG